MEETETAAWPDRFVYVCGAGGAARVNRSPMLHGGSRIAAVMILRATSSDPPGTNDDIQSVQPTERLIDYARNVLGLGKDRVEVMDRHVDSVREWLGALGQARDWARALGVEDVIFNVTGGRKPATLGALIGLPSQGEAPHVSLISVGLATGVRRISFTADGDVSERALPMKDRLPLGDYLQSYGYREVNPDRRRQAEKRFEKSAPVGNAILDAHRTTPRREKPAFRRHFGEMTKKVMASENGRSRRPPFPAEVDRDTLTFFQRHGWLDRIEGAKVQDGKLKVSEKFAQEFLGGKWLEAVIYARLLRDHAERNDVDIAAGLELELADAPRSGPPQPLEERDLVIFADERLDVVEAKAVTGTRGLNNDIAKLAERRGNLSGPAGRAWMVTPFLYKEDLEKPGILANAHHRGVELLFGAGAVDDLVGSVRKTVGGRG